MAHLIDKSALVAEIEKRKEMCDNHYGDYWNGCYNTFTDILSIIATLEVKEVDLELNSFDATVCKICNTYLKEMDKDAIVKAIEPYKDGDKVKVIIKATQKGEKI